MGTQKSRLNETVLLRTQTHVKTDGKENIHNFTVKMFATEAGSCEARDLLLILLAVVLAFDNRPI